VQYGHVSKLSGGEKRRLYLLTVLVRNPNFLILDEPTNDLDIITLQTLEQFLLDFQGCVLIVSHDRYFLDRLVDHVFAFEGNGIIKDFPGNYSEYRQWKYDSEDEAEELAKDLKNKEQLTAVISAEPLEQIMENPAKSEIRKLSFKEQKELETLEIDLAQLETRKTEIEVLLAGGLTNADEIQKTSLEFNTIVGSIDEKTTRWLELQC
jgi:ATP-binding cassette subfamily F protein uup